MRHRIRVLRARTLAWIGFFRLLAAIARGRVDEVWIGDSNAVFWASDRFPRLGIGSTEPRRWVWHLGPRLMYSLARDGFPHGMPFMMRLVGRVRRDPSMLWIFSAGEIDLRCHLVPRLADGADLGFVAGYLEQVRRLVDECSAPRAVVCVPVPAAVEIPNLESFPVVGSPEERRAAHRKMRERIVSEAAGVRPPGAEIHVLDATYRLSGPDGYMRPDVTFDGIHPNDQGRGDVRAAVDELRSELHEVRR